MHLFQIGRELIHLTDYYGAESLSDFQKLLFVLSYEDKIQYWIL
jgi:hypothetical protein